MTANVNVALCVEPQSHVEDQKLVLNRLTASTGRIDYMGGRLTAVDQAIAQTV